MLFKPCYIGLCPKQQLELHVNWAYISLLFVVGVEYLHIVYTNLLVHSLGSPIVLFNYTGLFVRKELSFIDLMVLDGFILGTNITSLVVSKTYIDSSLPSIAIKERKKYIWFTLLKYLHI